MFLPPPCGNQLASTNSRPPTSADFLEHTRGWFWNSATFIIPSLSGWKSVRPSEIPRIAPALAATAARPNRQPFLRSLLTEARGKGDRLVLCGKARLKVSFPYISRTAYTTAKGLVPYERTKNFAPEMIFYSFWMSAKSRDK